MKRKQGISLIVLVITIIVMIILAASVVITLNNSGIIEKANDAMDKTELQQVKQLASLAWMDGYMEGARTPSELETIILATLEKNKIDLDKYNIIVTENGVEVTNKADAPKINEYGFYYNQLYTGTMEANPMGITKISFVFYEGGASGGYGEIADIGNKKLLILPYDEGALNYSNKKITLDDGTGSNLVVSDDGLSMTGTFEGFAVNVTCKFEKMHGVYRNRVYTSMFPEYGNFEATLDNNNIARLYMNGALILEGNVTLSHSDHLIKQDGVSIGYATTDGEVLLLNMDDTEIPLVLSNATPPNTEYVAGLYNAAGNLIESWDTLVSKHGLDVERDYENDIDITAQPTHIYNIINNNPEYAGAVQIKVGKNVKRIGARALVTGNLENIKIITLPEGLETIADQAFAVSPNLARVTLPSTVKSIGWGIFTLSGVTTFNIPASVESLASGFGEWSNIAAFTVDENNPYYKAVNGVIYSKDGKELVQSPMTIGGELVVLEGTEVIKRTSVSFSAYTSIRIPASVTTIEDYAMEEMTKLETIIFEPNSKLRTIGRGAFLFASKLKNLEIPEGVTEINEYTFSGTSMMTLTLPSTITTMTQGDEFYVDKLILKSQTPPTIINEFYLNATDVNNNPVIVVPKGTSAAYKAAAGWSQYADYIIEAAE